jgi:hypothetical protein
MNSIIWVRGDILNVNNIAMISDASTDKDYIIEINLASGAKVTKNFGDNKREYNAWFREFGNAFGTEGTSEE